MESTHAPRERQQRDRESQAEAAPKADSTTRTGRRVVSESSMLELPTEEQDRPKGKLGEKVAWLVFALVVVAAALGLTGMGGLFARAEALGARATLDYPRVARWQASEEFVLQLKPGGAQAEILIPKDLLNIFGVEHITPTPVRSVAQEAGTLFVFDRAAAAGEIILHVRALKPAWPQQHKIVVDGAPMVFAPVVLP